MLVSAVLQSESALHVHASPPFGLPIQVPTEHWGGLLELHSGFSLVIYFIYRVHSAYLITFSLLHFSLLFCGHSTWTVLNVECQVLGETYSRCSLNLWILSLLHPNAHTHTHTYTYTCTLSPCYESCLLYSSLTTSWHCNAFFFLVYFLCLCPSLCQCAFHSAVV